MMERLNSMTRRFMKNTIMTDDRRIAQNRIDK
jgi:hypothetical protein